MLTRGLKTSVYEKIYPDINPLLIYRTLPPLDPKSWQDDITNLFLQIIISTSATHKAVQTRGDNDEVHLSREVYQYRAHALQRLNQRLRDPKSQVDDFTLLCVMSLLLAEVGDSHAPQHVALFSNKPSTADSTICNWRLDCTLRRSKANDSAQRRPWSLVFPKAISSSTIKILHDVSQLFTSFTPSGRR